MNQHYLLARLAHVNDLATQLEVTSRRLINEILDELQDDVVGSDDEDLGR